MVMEKVGFHNNGVDKAGSSHTDKPPAESIHEESTGKAEGIKSHNVSPNDDTAAVGAALAEKVARNIVSSGLNGISVDRISDAKCLHMHVADSLLRGPGTGANMIGDWALQYLAEQHGIRTDGGPG